MSDREFKFDALLNYGRGGCRVRLSFVSIPIPQMEIELNYLDDNGDDDSNIAKVATDNLNELRSIRDALNQILGD